MQREVIELPVDVSGSRSHQGRQGVMCAGIEVHVAPHASIEKGHPVADGRWMVAVAGSAVVGAFLCVPRHRVREPVEQHLHCRRIRLRNGIEQVAPEHIPEERAKPRPEFVDGRGHRPGMDRIEGDAPDAVVVSTLGLQPPLQDRHSHRCGADTVGEDADRLLRAPVVDALHRNRNVVLRDLVHAPAALRYRMWEHVAEPIVEQPHVVAFPPHCGCHVRFERVRRVDEASLREAVDQQHGRGSVRLRISCEL